MPYLETEETNLYYEVEGSGVPIIFSAGFASTCQSWLPYAKHFASDHQTVIFDQRGSGLSKGPSAPYTVEMLTQDLLGLLQHLSLPSAYFVGSSMGGAPVQYLALHHPDKVEGALLVAPFAQLPKTALIKSQTTGRLIEAGVPMELVVANTLPWLFSNHFLSSPERMREAIKQMSQNSYDRNLNDYYSQMHILESFNLTSQLHLITSHFDLVVGEEDLSTPPSCARLMAQMLPHSSLKIVCGAGHMLHLEQQEEIISCIKKLLTVK